MGIMVGGKLTQGPVGAIRGMLACLPFPLLRVRPTSSWPVIETG